jgi:hypothetical protein
MTSPAFALAGGNFDRTPPRPSADSTQQSRIWQGADWHWTPAWIGLPNRRSRPSPVLPVRSVRHEKHIAVRPQLKQPSRLGSGTQISQIVTILLTCDVRTPPAFSGQTPHKR